MKSWRFILLGPLGLAVAVLYGVSARGAEPRLDVRLAYTSQVQGEVEPCG